MQPRRDVPVRGIATATAGVIHLDLKPENIFLSLTPPAGVNPKVRTSELEGDERFAPR